MKQLLILFVLFLGLGMAEAQTKDTPQRIEEKELVSGTEPSKDATVLFIKTKLANGLLWYTNLSSVPGSNCDKSALESMFRPSSTSFVTNTFVFTATCSYDPTMTGTLTLFLDKVTSIDIEGKHGLTLKSDKPFFEVIHNGEKIKPNLSTTITFLDVSDNEKVRKAFKHLCKLLNIQLVDDMF
ncbi:hypothetical protein [Sphingobacterium suaedae]|uniref:Uncharacterized protein n=1 Tax=Sphingobacterium suaedae TaxID=1686402 RepID=A0ABW5KN84_9SPHI